MSHDAHTLLRNQSLARALTDEEQALALALEKAFRSGLHNFDDVARALEQDGVKRPSGSAGPWSADVLEQELMAINSSLDAAYAANGTGA
jgi:recombinase-like protein